MGTDPEVQPPSELDTPVEQPAYTFDEPVIQTADLSFSGQATPTTPAEVQALDLDQSTDRSAEELPGFTDGEETAFLRPTFAEEETRAHDADQAFDGRDTQWIPSAESTKKPIIVRPRSSAVARRAEPKARAPSKVAKPPETQPKRRGTTALVRDRRPSAKRKEPQGPVQRVEKFIGQLDRTWLTAIVAAACLAPLASLVLVLKSDEIGQLRRPTTAAPPAPPSRQASPQPPGEEPKEPAKKSTRAPPAKRATDPIGLNAFVRRPGVRLIGVQFHASWKASAQEELLAWERLASEYRREGLRVWVVVSQDIQACELLGWTPDRVVCDPEGRIAQQFGVGERMPVAHIWDWRGRLVASHERAEVVEKQIKAALRNVPRVVVRPGPIDSATELPELRLVELVRSALAREGKIAVLASPEEEEQLHELRRLSHEQRFSERHSLSLGKLRPPNALVEASIRPVSGKPHVFLKFLDAKSGGLVSSAWAPWDSGDELGSAREAARELVEGLSEPIDVERVRHPQR